MVHVCMGKDQAFKTGYSQLFQAAFQPASHVTCGRIDHYVLLAVCNQKHVAPARQDPDHPVAVVGVPDPHTHLLFIFILINIFLFRDPRHFNFQVAFPPGKSNADKKDIISRL